MFRALLQLAFLFATVLVTPWSRAQSAGAVTAADLNRQSVELTRAEPVRARQLAAEALKLAEADKDGAQQAMAHVNLGRSALLLGDYPEAIRSFQTGVVLARQQAEPVQIAVAMESLAVVLDRTGLQDQSLNLHREALTIFERANEWQRAAQVQVNLGNLYDGIGQKEESRAHYLRALATLDRIGADKGRGSIYNNLSQLDSSPEQSTQSLEMLDRAMHHYRQENNQIGLGLAWRNRATILTRLGRYGEATAAVDEAQAIADATSHRLGLSAAHEARAELLLAQVLGATPTSLSQSLLGGAGRELDSAIAIARELGEDNRIERLLRMQAEWAEMSGEPAVALDRHKQAEALEAVRERQDSEQRLVALSAQFQSERQQLDIARLGEAAARQTELLDHTRMQRNWTVVGSVLLALLLLLAGSLVHTRNRLLSAERAQNQALQSAFAQAEQARRSAEEDRRINGELLTLAAHDLHGALGMVVGAAERMLGSGQLGIDSRQQVASIANTANEISEVIGNLVAITALDRDSPALQQTRFDLIQLLDDLVQQWQGRAVGKRLRLTLDVGSIQDGPAWIVGDRIQIAEALDQLIGNAIKFSLPNRRIEVRLVLDPALARIEVHDEGPGLTDADRRRAFGRFQRLSARPTGGERSTGIGLALVKRIVDLHGGEVGFAPSTFGPGACFYIALQRPDQQTP
ncbi:MAG: tetratricopeptide repeat-containing sensor histidine kinase [Ahniella sp.]|nr:tetratricopeptide repeat-containing sensor histidine kinase [Ahniella sp.]